MTISDLIVVKVERLARALARRSSRRGFLARLGVLLVGAQAIPLLPVARGAHAAAPAADENEDPSDPRSCSYWRYCGLDGTLCACCGGTHTSCPPGTVPGVLHWIGTCRNPADGRDYLISYVDCCGASTCTRCPCSRNEDAKPIYSASKSNDINWCTGAPGSFVPSCTTALVLGSVKPD